MEGGRKEKRGRKRGGERKRGRKRRRKRGGKKKRRKRGRGERKGGIREGELQHEATYPALSAIHSLADDVRLIILLFY